MCWLDPAGGDGTKILHLRLKPGDRWLPYTAPQFTHVRQPDTALSGIDCSKGFRTSQYLLGRAWTYVPSAQAYSDRLSAIKDAQQQGLVQ